jgi:hypothetical protein
MQLSRHMEQHTEFSIFSAAKQLLTQHTREIKIQAPAMPWMPADGFNSNPDLKSQVTSM